MAPDPRRGVALALLCLLILGVMPILATARPAGTGSLVFTAWMTAWQLVASLPLLIREHAAGHRTLLGQVPDGTAVR